jgi:hypothetical protein
MPTTIVMLASRFSRPATANTPPTAVASTPTPSTTRHDANAAARNGAATMRPM